MNKLVELFFNPVCPFCPQARKLLESYQAQNPWFQYTEVNTYTEEGIKRGMSLRVMAVPSIAVDGRVKIAGWPFTVEDLEKALE